MSKGMLTMTEQNGEDFERLTFPQGAVLLREGETAEAVYVVVSGAVEIRAGRVGPGARNLAVRRAGDVIGELSALDGEPHMASAVALEETVVNAMSVAEFHRRMESMDTVMRGVMRMLARRLRETSDRLAGQSGITWDKRD